MMRVTSSDSYGTTGFSRRSAKVSSDKTTLAATRSSALAAAKPASSSPDLTSLALAKTSFTDLN